MFNRVGSTQTRVCYGKARYLPELLAERYGQFGMRTDRRVSSVMAGTKVVLETSVYSTFNQLTQLQARENFADFSRCEIFKLCKSGAPYVINTV